MSYKQQFFLFAFIFVLIALLMKFYAVMVVQPNWDDNYYMSIAVNYEDYGLLTPRMWRFGADANIIAGSGTGYGIYLPILWFQAIGINIFSGRIMMYLVGLLILPVVYLTARLWWGHLAGVVAVVCTVLNPMYFYNYNLRMDAFGQLSYALVLLLHIYAVKSKRHYLHFLVGVLAVLTTEMHILGLFYLLGLAFYHTVEQIQSIVSQRHLHLRAETVYYMVGSLIAGLIYVAVHILPDPADYFLISDIFERSLLNEVTRIFAFFYNLPAISLLFALGLYSIIRRSSPQNRHFLIILLGVYLAAVVLNPPPWFPYITHFLPLFSLGFAAFFHNYCKTIAQIRQRTIYLTAGLGCFLLIPFVYTLSVDFENLPYGEVKIDMNAIAYIRENIATDVVVAGPPYAFSYLIDYRNFMSVLDLEVLVIDLHNESYTDFLEREAPQVIMENTYAVTSKLGVHPEVLPALQLYIESHDFVEVLPGLLVSEALINSEQP